jgi:hypothetical protein
VVSLDLPQQETIPTRVAVENMDEFKKRVRERQHVVQASLDASVATLISRNQTGASSSYFILINEYYMFPYYD